MKINETILKVIKSNNNMITTAQEMCIRDRCGRV